MCEDFIESTLYLHLSETRSGDDAARHQRYIEREGPCVASVGTLADTVVDRERVWHAIAQLGTLRKGWIEFGHVDARLLAEVAKPLRRWAAEGRVEQASVTRWKAAVRELLVGARDDDLAPDWKCKVRTHDAMDHATIRATVVALYGATRSATEWPAQVAERRPRASVVQRQITLELDPELGIDRQLDIVVRWCEASLEHVSWHACIHRDNTDERDAWRDTAHVVYTQFALDAECDGAGHATGWWTLERAGRLPSPALVVNILWGKGPAGRSGTRTLIETWRTRLMELQNAHLETMGSSRRYRTSSSRHRSPVRLYGTREQPAGSATSETPQQSQVERETQGQTLGQKSGEFESPYAGRSKSAVAVEANRIEEWLKRWRRWLADEVDGERVGWLAAEIVGRWSEAEVRRRASDPRREVRALCAHAQRWQREVGPWRQRVQRICGKPASNGVQVPEVERLIEELAIHGIRLRAVTTREQRRQLVATRWLGRAMTAADEAEDAIRGALDSKEVDAVVRAWLSRYERSIWLHEAIGETWTALAATSQTVKKSLRDREALESSKTVGARGHVDPDLVRKHFREVLCNSDAGRGDPRKLIRVATKSGLMDVIADFDPGLGARLRSALDRVDQRREASCEMGRRLGVTATVPEERVRQAARLSPTDAAAWVGHDMEIVRRYEPTAWSAVQKRLQRFAAIARRRINKRIKQAASDDRDRAVAAALSAAELAVLECVAPALAQEVMDAKRRAEDQRKRFVRRLRDSASAIGAEREPERRSQLQTRLADSMAGEQARTALSRAQWMRLVRTSGLGPLEIGDGVRLEAARSCRR